MYYLVTVGWETERLDREGNPRLIKTKYPVEAESTEEAVERMNRYMSDDSRSGRILTTTESKFECVIDPKNTPEVYKVDF